MPCSRVACRAPKSKLCIGLLKPWAPLLRGQHSPAPVRQKLLGKSGMKRCEPHGNCSSAIFWSHFQNLSMPCMVAMESQDHLVSARGCADLDTLHFSLLGGHPVQRVSAHRQVRAVQGHVSAHLRPSSPTSPTRGVAQSATSEATEARAKTGSDSWANICRPTGKQRQLQQLSQLKHPNPTPNPNGSRARPAPNHPTFPLSSLRPAPASRPGAVVLVKQLQGRGHREGGGVADLLPRGEAVVKQLLDRSAASHALLELQGAHTSRVQNSKTAPRSGVPLASVTF